MDGSLFKTPPIAGQRLIELSEKKPKVINTAMLMACIGAKTSLAGHNKITYIYKDNSKLTIYLNGTCIVHTGWIKEENRKYYLDDESLDIMTLCLA